MTTDKPNWKHDCPHCHFLGAVLAGDKIADLYYCTGLFIAQYSDKADDNTTTDIEDFKSNRAELLVAYQKAKDQHRI